MGTLPCGVRSDLGLTFFGFCTLQGEKGKRGVDGVDGMKVTLSWGRAGSGARVSGRDGGRGWPPQGRWVGRGLMCGHPWATLRQHERQETFPAKPQVPVDPKPPGQAQSSFCRVGLSWEAGGWASAERLDHRNRLPPCRGRRGTLACQAARARPDSM